MCSQEECEQLYDSTDKWKVSVLFGVIFMIISSPILYTFMEKLNLHLAINGRPSILGLIVNSIIFMVIIRLLLE